MVLAPNLREALIGTARELHEADQLRGTRFHYSRGQADLICAVLGWELETYRDDVLALITKRIDRTEFRALHPELP